MIARIRNDVCLLVVGPDNWGYKSKLQGMLDAETSERVIFTGMLVGENKMAALACADLFVLPSLSEGFSNAVLEAMACGLPVIISPQCNFPEVEMLGAGRVVEPEVGQLGKAINELLDQPETCRQMGDKARALVNDQYNWDNIADNMIAAYERIINVSRN
jgi:glycosyltransferase involved in cell wall biosynthesis